MYVTVPERALTAEQVAQLLGCHPATVRRLARRRDLPPPRRVGGSGVRWLESEITAWLRARPQHAR